jgi:hypothetical protein
MLDRALFWGPLAAMVAAFPAAIRLSGGGIAFPDALIAVAAILCVPIIISIAAGGVVRREYGKLEADMQRRVELGLLIWAAMCLVTDAVLGTVLQSSTHHRPLAGVTFAVMALGVAIGSALVAWRCEAAVTGLIRRRGFRRYAVGAPVFLVKFAILIAFLSAVRLFSPAARSCWIDAVIALLAVGAGVYMPTRKRLWAVGLAAMAVVLAVGAQRLGSSDQLVAAIGARAPVAWAVGATAGIVP